MGGRERQTELDVRAADGSIMKFAPTRAKTRTTLTQYLKDRGITGD